AIRGAVEARALVTRRIRPLRLPGAGTARSAGPGGAQGAGPDAGPDAGRRSEPRAGSGAGAGTAWAEASGAVDAGGDRWVHQVAIPFHWGSAGPVTGDVANDLVPLSGEPNVTIHEGKALLCDVVPGRRPRGRDLIAWLEERTGAARTRAASGRSPVTEGDG
ncbi:MAG: hypothetical protein ACLF0P_13890, partial [Thermoanaerobaculia bacterium]